MVGVKAKEEPLALWPERALTAPAGPVGQDKHPWQGVPHSPHPVNSEVKVLDCGISTPPNFCSILIYLCDKRYCIHFLKSREGVADKKEGNILPLPQTWKGLQPQLPAHPPYSGCIAQTPHFVQPKQQHSHTSPPGKMPQIVPSHVCSGKNSGIWLSSQWPVTERMSVHLAFLNKWVAETSWKSDIWALTHFLNALVTYCLMNTAEGYLLTNKILLYGNNDPIVCQFLHLELCNLVFLKTRHTYNLSFFTIGATSSLGASFVHGILGHQTQWSLESFPFQNVPSY